MHVLNGAGAGRPRRAALRTLAVCALLASPWVANAAPVLSGAPATKDELFRMFEHLEGALDATGFFRPPEKRPHMVEALRAMLHRAQFSEQEVRTLRGVITALEKRPTRPRRLADGRLTTERGRGD